MNLKKINALLLFLCLVFLTISGQAQPDKEINRKEPKIVNIVNFIRLLEPRDPQITKDVLYETVVKQIDLMNKFHLGGTFLLQYDALIDPRYQKLLKSLPKQSFEIGAWWELPQPLIEKAGIKWRGKYAWDWHSDVGFSVGYTPAEREKIIDVYFTDFKKIFGYYPRSLASRVIDAHSLSYMYDKYKIVASANCKDQVGTDGFTLWGGYWNQAYYPSRVNSYMPAQHADQQLPVPVFRMLGSDPIRQYADRGKVTTLEPVYNYAGGNEQWVNWFFRTFADDPSLGFNYTQAGQENSFTWKEMQKGLEMQMPIISQLRDKGKVRVETLSESGAWFRKKYPVTPATSFVVTKDLGESDKKTIWFNSRFYRMNILWDKGTMRIADIHLFNERIPDKYLKSVTMVNQSFFYTLPIVDGFQWGKRGNPTGLRLVSIAAGKSDVLKGGDPVFTNIDLKTAHVSWPCGSGSFEIDLGESAVTIKTKGDIDKDWAFELNINTNDNLPVRTVTDKQVSYSFDGHQYQFKAEKGKFSVNGSLTPFRLLPENGVIKLLLTDLK
ncbi:MAG: hypothetical protein JKY70_05510 [Mucilaginibacter sp.]|nr:hypothetical protein [Mucilaginibacter sp.]